MNKFRIFTRTWWKENPEWPNGLEPCIGPKRTIGKTQTIEAARKMCEQYNSTTALSTARNRRLSMKAEFESI